MQKLQESLGVPGKVAPEEDGWKGQTEGQDV